MNLFACVETVLPKFHQIMLWQHLIGPFFLGHCSIKNLPSVFCVNFGSIFSVHKARLYLTFLCKFENERIKSNINNLGTENIVNWIMLSLSEKHVKGKFPTKFHLGLHYSHEFDSTKRLAWGCNFASFRDKGSLSGP